MKYSFNTWVYGSFPVWLPSYPLEEVIKRLAIIGYDGVEIGCAAPHAWPDFLNKERRSFLKKTLDENNIKASSLLPAPGGGPGNTTAFLSIDLVKMALGQFDLGPAAAMSLIYFFIVLLVCWIFYNLMMKNEAQS